MTPSNWAAEQPKKRIADGGRAIKCLNSDHRSGELLKAVHMDPETGVVEQFPGPTEEPMMSRVKVLDI